MNDLTPQTPCRRPTDFNHRFIDPYWSKPKLWGKHCRGLGCDDFNERESHCGCKCSACSPPVQEKPDRWVVVWDPPINKLKAARIFDDQEEAWKFLNELVATGWPMNPMLVRSADRLWAGALQEMCDGCRAPQPGPHTSETCTVTTTTPGTIREPNDDDIAKWMDKHGVQLSAEASLRDMLAYLVMDRLRSSRTAIVEEVSSLRRMARASLEMCNEKDAEIERLRSILVCIGTRTYGESDEGWRESIRGACESAKIPDDYAKDLNAAVKDQDALRGGVINEVADWVSSGMASGMFGSDSWSLRKRLAEVIRGAEPEVLP